MNNLTPPTDNLYKFIAITGVVLFLLSFGYPSWFAGKLLPSMNETAAELAVMAVDVKHSQEDLDEFKRKIAELREKTDSIGAEVEGKRTEQVKMRAQTMASLKKILDRMESYGSSRGLDVSEAREAKNRMGGYASQDKKRGISEVEKAMAEIEKESLALSSRIEQAEKKSREIERAKALVMAKQEAWEGQWRFVGWVCSVSLIGCVAGALLSWKGFTLWYHKVQKHEDAMLEAEAATVKNNQAP